MDTKVPFYKNTSDNTHCFQACIKMLTKYYWPEKNYTWEELEEITGKTKNLWTWIMAGSVWLKKQGLDIRDIEIFDYLKFIKLKEKYLIEFYGEDVGKEQIRHSNIERELSYTEEFIKHISIEKRIPEINNILKLLENGYLVVCCLNQQILNNKQGYVGHFVLIKGNYKEGFILHDPGLPAFPERKVAFSLFKKAWAYPDKKAKNILAFRQ